MICVGNNFQSDQNGLKTSIPEGKDILWLRVANYEYVVYRVTYLDGNKETLPKTAAGLRKLNEIAPDGAISDSNYESQVWVPISVPRSG
jgi:hypothetical protein